MNISMKAKRVLLVAVAAMTVTGSVAGAALATGARTSPKTAAPVVEVTTPDTDTIQSGDQTSPDPSTETGGENTGATSDGPGGHEDPPGDVNHEFSGAE